jgi:hypothetical protein
LRSKPPAPQVGNFQTTAEKRICCMAAQPNRDSILSWRKSRASGGGGECVEVAKSESSVLVRDSGDPTGLTLELTRAQWRELVRHIKTGATDPARVHDAG